MWQAAEFQRFMKREGTMPLSNDQRAELLRAKRQSAIKLRQQETQRRSAE